VIIKSLLPDIDIPLTCIGDAVFANVDAEPDAVAMIDGPSGRTFTRSSLRDAVASLAGGLIADGVTTGEVIALMAANSPEYAIAFHAIARAGATVTTVNPTYGVDEVAYQLNNAGARRIIVDAAFVETARAAGGSEADITTIGAADGYRSIDELAGAPAEQVPVDPATHTVVMPYSSGTTGLPKGVMLTHLNLVANILQLNVLLDGKGDEVCLSVLPFFHIYGMQATMNAALAEGTCVITMPRFDMAAALDHIASHAVTLFYAVPPIVLGLAKSPLVDEHDLSSLRKIICGAAPLGAELTDEAASRVGCAIVQAYGMTEMSPISHCTHGINGRAGSSGIIAPNTECRLVDENDADVAPGEVGELLVRGPQVMPGYLGNEQATRESLTEDGWLRTGDLARVDEDGYFYMVDRLKELIKVSGFQVAPAELEALIVTHPAVADVAVISIPDEETGERPKAIVVLKPEQQASADEIREFVAGHVARYKHLAEVSFAKSIPKSASGKILRRMLRDG
jgi:4-coumarate--CoA ligase